MPLARKAMYVNGEVIQEGEEIPDELLVEGEEAVGDHAFMQEDEEVVDVNDLGSSSGSELEDLTVPQLQTRARKLGVPIRPGMKKADLIVAIEAKTNVDEEETE